MKVKAISHDPEQFTRSRSNDLYKIARNFDPALHPFEKAREYTRALNSVKLDRLFAKPFVGALSGHIDGVYSMAKHPRDLTSLCSGSADGEIRLWSLSERKTIWKAQGHKGFVRGICFNPLSDHIITCGDDKTIKIWEPRGSDKPEEPVQIIHGKHFFSSVDHHAKKTIFATAGNQIDIWDQMKSVPVSTFSWGADTINTVRFNQTEVSLFASAGTDRTVVLYDIRYQSPISKLVMKLRANAISWNPMEAFNFSVASEDHCCYTFDMRKMDCALNVFKDHVSAVMDLDYSPTGQEIVTGSYDKTIRIYRVNEGHSREIYHTKRMQRAFCVKFSMDSKYILSGSDDGNIRLWKTNAAEAMYPKVSREEKKLEYAGALKKKFAHMPELRKIDRHRHIPKSIKSAQEKKRTMVEAVKNKEENRRRHQKEGTVPHIPERKKAVVKVEK